MSLYECFVPKKHLVTAMFYGEVSVHRLTNNPGWQLSS
jgi:hypothetical protein